ncbi:MAG: AraC family transcriptional regulator [Bacteroidales bacterium]|nr:AraC family transcriptional regulator [Bacteroidales bacterium]
MALKSRHIMTSLQRNVTLNLKPYPRTMTDTTYMILYSANLAFIVTHLYGWLLKWFYRPEAYREHFHELFPAQRAVGIIYLLQIFELPYLLQIGDSDALLYVNAFSLLCFSIQMLIMCEGYFFPEIKHRLNGYWLFIPAILVLLPMFLQAVNLIDMPEGWRVWSVGAVSLLFVAYFSLSVRMALRIRNAVRRANEDQYADIAARCGFSSQASMTKAFKAQGKETPSTYRGM